MEPVVLALQNKYSAKMEFVIADTNTEDGSTLAGHYNVYYIPAVYILDGQGNILNNIPYSEINANPQGSKTKGFVMSTTFVLGMSSYQFKLP